MEEFKKRILTSIIGIPLVLTAIYLGGPVYLLFIETVIILGLLEFFQLTRLTDRSLKIIGVVSAVLMSLVIYLNNGQNHIFHNNPSDFLITLIFLALLLSAIFRSDLSPAWPNIILVFTGIFYVAWNLSFLLLIREEFAWGREYIYLIFAVIWAVDIGAYFTGVKWGRHKLAPQISPHKSWEGALGGVIFGLAAVAVIKISFLAQKPWLGCLALGLAITIVGQLSDLVESALKRNYGVKDSGSLLPGHGGILDRFDSILLSAPIAYYLIKFLL